MNTRRQTIQKSHTFSRTDNGFFLYNNVSLYHGFYLVLYDGLNVVDLVPEIVTIQILTPYSQNKILLTADGSPAGTEQASQLISFTTALFWSVLSESFVAPVTALTTYHVWFPDKLRNYTDYTETCQIAVSTFFSSVGSPTNLRLSLNYHELI